MRWREHLPDMVSVDRQKSLLRVCSVVIGKVPAAPTMPCGAGSSTFWGPELFGAGTFSLISFSFLSLPFPLSLPFVSFPFPSGWSKGSRIWTVQRKTPRDQKMESCVRSVLALETIKLFVLSRVGYYPVVYWRVITTGTTAVVIYLQILVKLLGFLLNQGWEGQGRGVPVFLYNGIFKFPL